MKRVNDNKRNDFWGAIVTAVAGIGTSVAGFVISAKEAVKPQIDSIMYNYVYLEGVSYKEIKNEYEKLWKKNKKYFDQQYENWAYKRAVNIKNGTHDKQIQAEQKKMLLIVLGCVIIVLVFLIFKK